MYSDDSWGSYVKLAIRASVACALIISLAVGGTATLSLAPFIFIYVFVLMIVVRAIADGAMYVHKRFSKK